MSLPNRINIEQAYNLMIKKEKVVKPASVGMRWYETSNTTSTT